MSCMEEPHVFLNQLRDHNLVPEELYKNVKKMKCKDRRQEGVYQILDWLEKERGQCVKLFWSCVLKNHILQKYSVLRMLRTSLQNGSYRVYTGLLDAQELNKKEKDSIQSKEDKENEQTSGRKRKQSTEGTEKPFSNYSQKKPAKKPTFAAPDTSVETREDEAVIPGFPGKLGGAVGEQVRRCAGALPQRRTQRLLNLFDPRAPARCKQRDERKEERVNNICRNDRRGDCRRE